MTYKSFICEVEDGIATVRLNNPERISCLCGETAASLQPGLIGA